LRDGDLVLSLGGQVVNGVDDLHRVLSDGALGKALAVSVLRGAQRLELRILPAEPPRD
jgi:S1-C subfamily serine protease